MFGLKEMLLKEQSRLEKMRSEVEARLESAPEGWLRISKCRKYTQYYVCTEETRKEKENGRYLGVNEQGLVRLLAQKGYDEKVLKCVQRRLEQIRRLTKDYEDDEIEKIYYKEHRERREMICPVEETGKEKLERWLNEKYEGKDFREDQPVILTDRGERVRSKSEKILADYFYRNGISYKYECPLFLNGYGLVYPDFTFLSPRTGEEIYWEHHGKMDDPVYARNAVKKILLYESNGIFSGERLMLTFETDQTVLNTGIVERMAKRYLMT